jgi:hypothetical protein
MFPNWLRSFPEWHNADDHLESALRLSVKKRASFEEAQGRSFNEFARKQADSVQDRLFKLDGSLKTGEEAIKTADETIPKIRSEFAKLRPLNDDIKLKRKQAQSIQERLQKSQKVCARALEKLDQLRAKAPASPDFAKAQDEYDIALRQKTADQEAADARIAQLDTELKEYRRQFIVIVLNTLEQYAAAKETEGRVLIQTGQQLQIQGEGIQEFEDSTIEVLQGELQQLNSEPVE